MEVSPLATSSCTPCITRCCTGGNRPRAEGHYIDVSVSDSRHCIHNTWARWLRNWRIRRAKFRLAAHHQYLRLAAEAAERRLGHREAIALLERALSFANKLPADTRALKEIETLEALASILYLSGDTTASRFEELASHASQCGIIDIEVRALMDAGILWSWSDSTRGLELLDRADRLNARQADPLARASARMKCMYGRLLNGRDRATDVSDGRNAILELRNAGLLTGEHLTGYAHLLLTCSEHRESRRCALEGLALLTKDSQVNPCADRAQINAAFVLCNDALFLGELGEALRVVEAAVAALTRNGNEAFAHMLRLWRARLCVVAHDFEGALKICESVARGLGDLSPLPATHLRLAVSGTAEVALGRYEQALEHLSLARHEMDREPALNDLSCYLLLESALAELWLAKGDLAQASAHGERLLELALGTQERTWQALAWDANTRVGMAKGDLEHAESCIAKASAMIESFEIPLAAWPVHATAAALCDRMGSVKLAKRHRQLSRATILKIADSLAPGEPLRKTFLSATAVAEIVGSFAGDKGLIETELQL